MCYFENSVRVPMIIYHPEKFEPHRVITNVSTLDLLPTLCDLVQVKLAPNLPMDGISMLPQLEGKQGHDTVIAEYMGEGTVRPLMMIKRGPWKYITCPCDPPMLFNLAKDPLELDNLAGRLAQKPADSMTDNEKEAWDLFQRFEAEAKNRWDMDGITRRVLKSQRSRRLVWSALVQGTFTNWDYNPLDDGRNK